MTIRMRIRTEYARNNTWINTYKYVFLQNNTVLSNDNNKGYGSIAGIVLWNNKMLSNDNNKGYGSMAGGVY